jgi:hypothetical protein
VQEYPNFKDGTWLETPFLPEDPNKMLAEGKIVNDVPTITGFTQDEGIPLGYGIKLLLHSAQQILAQAHFFSSERKPRTVYASEKEF